VETVGIEAPPAFTPTLNLPRQGGGRVPGAKAAVMRLPVSPIEGGALAAGYSALSPHYSALLAQRGHHTLGQQLDRPQHFGLFHTGPLDAEDEAVHPQRLGVAPQLSNTVARVADDEAVPH
jgi:hypothetical protein